MYANEPLAWLQVENKRNEFKKTTHTNGISKRFHTLNLFYIQIWVCRFFSTWFYSAHRKMGFDSVQSVKQRYGTRLDKADFDFSRSNGC